MESFEDFEDVDDVDDREPGRRQIREANRAMLAGQARFRQAADAVAAAFARAPSVERVVLFGSVAVPLEKEVPRFREFRRARIPIYHECKDVDLAVWLGDLGQLEALRKAASRALNDLLRERDIGVAHHQVDTFIIEPGTGRYLGRLCHFATCPKPGKAECRVPGCGASPFLRQHEEFVFDAKALAPERTAVLFEPARGARAVQEG